MMASYIEVPIAGRLAARAALAKALADAAGLPFGTGGYTGMPSLYTDGSLAPPGVGEMTALVPERVSRDGLSVAFVVDDADGVPLTLTDRRGQTLVRPRDLAGSTVAGVALPELVERDESHFPDPETDPSLMSRPGEPGSRRP